VLGRVLGAVAGQQDQSPATLYDGEATFSPLVNAEGAGQQGRYRRRSPVRVIRARFVTDGRGQAGGSLVDSRSAAEYGLTANGAGWGESPSALAMNGGSLALDEMLKQLGTGLYISNLWYLNFSDQPAARMTGMTRFATFWVEDGKIKALVSTMRFDDSVFSLLGGALEALTTESELHPVGEHLQSASDTSSALLPGALLNRLTLTL
jgi:predicted Zn-dependent protease